MNAPDDPKHPAEPKSQAPGPSTPSEVRDQIHELDEEEHDEDAKTHNLLAIGLLVLIVGIGIVLAFSMMRAKSTEPAEEAPVAHADSAASDTTSAADTTSAGGDTPSTAAAKPPAPPPPAAKPAPPPPTTTAATPPPEPPAPSRFGIAVGTFINADRAKSESDRLASSTGLEGQVVTVKEDGGDSYRVVLGDFPSRSDAEKKADELAGNQLVREARVIALKKKPS